MFRLLPAFLLALALAMPAFADDEEEIQRHGLTAQMLENFKAASTELEKLGHRPDKSLEDRSLDEAARTLEARPGARPVLEKYGFSGRSYRLTAGAIAIARMYLSMEPGLSKKDREAQLASFPPQMRANIELLRGNLPPPK